LLSFRLCTGNGVLIPLKKPPKVKKEKEVKEEKDEFDALVESGSKPLDDRLGISPDKAEKKSKKGGGKQTTLPFKPVKRDRKSKGSDSDNDEINFETLSPPRAPRAPRRAAASSKKYNLSSDDDGDKSDSPEPELLENNEVVERPPANSPIPLVSDSDEDMQIDKTTPPTKQSSEELFDSLVGSSPVAKQSRPMISSSSEDSPVKATPPPKKSRAPAKKKTENGGGSKGVKRPKKSSSGSDSDDIFTSKKIVAAKKKPRKSDSAEESDGEDSPPMRKPVGRARKPVSYALASDDSD